MSINYINFGTTNVLASITLPPSSKKVLEQGSQFSEVHIILDKSGSMAGAAYKNAIDGVSNLLETMMNENFPFENISIYLFNDVCQKLRAISYSDAQTRLSNSVASGSTYFKNVITELSNTICSSKIDNHCIVFFTDGCDSNSTSHVSLVNDFKNHVPKLYSTQMHCIGLGDHDSQFLNGLIDAGTIQGTYQYCTCANEIKLSIASIIGVLDTNIRKGTLTVGTVQHNFTSTDGVTAYLILPNDQVLDEVTLDYDSTKSVLKANVTKVTVGSIEFYVSHLRNLVMKLVKSDMYFLQKEKHVLALDADLEKIKENFKSLPPLSKKNAMESYLVCKELIGEVLELWRKHVKIDDQKLASIANKAYSNDLKKGLRRRLNMRVAENANLEAEISDKLTAITSNMDWTKLENELPAEANDYTCVVSCDNVIDAMKKSDVMCLTFNMSRSGASVVSPENLRINGICSSKLTFGAFCESLVYKLNVDSTAHGGFDPNAKSSILVGEARDEINAVLPMYICPEHWAMSSQCMKLAFGWMCTLDILGYDFLQLVSLPFAVLSYIRSQPKSSFNESYEKCVYDVCRAICEENPNYFTNVIAKANKYIDDGSVRTIDQIQNNYIFLEQLGVLKTIPTFSEKITLDVNSDKFIFYLLEEELRRWNKNYFNDPTVKFFTEEKLLEILAIDRHKLIDQPVDKYEKLKADHYKNGSKNLDFYYKQGCILIGLDPNNSKSSANSTEKLVYEDKLVELDGILCKPSDELCEVVEKFYSPVDKIWNFVSHNFAVGTINPLKKINWQQKVAMCLQNLSHCDNSARREAFEKKSYVNMLNFDDCIMYIKVLRMNVVASIKKKLFDQIDSKYTKLSGNDTAEAFCLANDIPTAVGALKGVYQGRIEFRQIFLKLSSDTYLLAQSKLNMLLTGQYRGIRLIMDGERDGSPNRPFWQWNPRTRNANRFYNTYQNIKVYQMNEDHIEILNS